MSEKLHSAEGAPQNHAEIERAAVEQLKSLEKAGEHGENKQERLEAAHEQLRKVEQARPAAEASPKSEPATHRGVLTQAANYRQTMVSLQHRMKPATRRFSAFIHQPVIENVSEIVGSTVMRPSVTLGATIGAVLVDGFVYLYARSQGFPMKGSIVLISLLVGALAGLIVEVVYRSLRRPQR